MIQCASFACSSRRFSTTIHLAPYRLLPTRTHFEQGSYNEQGGAGEKASLLFEDCSELCFGVTNIVEGRLQKNQIGFGMLTYSKIKLLLVLLNRFSVFSFHLLLQHLICHWVQCASFGTKNWYDVYVLEAQWTEYDSQEYLCAHDIFIFLRLFSK